MSKTSMTTAEEISTGLEWACTGMLSCFYAGLEGNGVETVENFLMAPDLENKAPFSESFKENRVLLAEKERKKRRRKPKWGVYRVHKAPMRAVDIAEFEEYIQDELFAVQKGPLCAAASVASVLKSLALSHGVSYKLCDGVINQELVQSVYKRMGIKEIERTSKHVGNMTLQRCVRLVKIPGAEHIRFAPRVLDAPLAEDSCSALWERLSRELKSGTRVIAHIHNHYVRVFGVRQGKEGCPKGKPVTFTRSSGGDSDAEDDGEGETGESTEEEEIAGTSRREVLLATKGQSPKHWVAWSDVHDLLSKHKIHKLIAVDVIRA